jgi:hypothetical protein
MDDLADDPVLTSPSRPAPAGLPVFLFTFTDPAVAYDPFGAMPTSANPLFLVMVPSALVLVVVRT